MTSCKAAKFGINEFRDQENVNVMARYQYHDFMCSTSRSIVSDVSMAVILKFKMATDTLVIFTGTKLNMNLHTIKHQDLEIAGRQLNIYNLRCGSR